MTNVVNEQEITIEKSPTVGERLSHARKAKKLTIADIANELRLTKQTIELIENEQWSELHGRAYARGYFSNYVKFLGLPEDEFLAAFNIEYTVAEPTLSVARHHVEISNKRFVWLPSLLFITMAVIAWFAYQQIQNTADVVINDASSISPDALANNVVSIDEISKENENIVPGSQQEMNEPEQLVSPDIKLSINGEQNNHATSDNSEIIPVQELGTIALQNIAQQSNNNDIMLENTATTLADGVLDLRFSDDCWVEVKDASNKVLLKKLMTKDDSIILTGRTPLTVMLGRTSVTQVRFNDELFDPSAFTERDVARFTLGAES